MGCCQSAESAAEFAEWHKKYTRDYADYSLDGKKMYIAVTDVYDGDTFWAEYRVSDRAYRSRCRMTGIDAPEMKLPRDWPESKRAAGKAAAIAARDALRGRIEAHGGIVWAEFGKNDIWARPLVTVFTERGGENLNNWMIARGYAVPYDGGHKAEFTVPDDKKE